MTSGAEIWTLTQKAVYRMRVGQKTKNRYMLGIKLRLDSEIQGQNKAQDVEDRIMKVKWN